MKKLFFAIACCYILVSCQEQKDLPSYIPKFIVSDSSLFPIAKDQAHTFGYLEVPMNRSMPAGPKVQLPVYIFKSRSSNPKPDPIIYTVGGPGYTTMPSAQYMKYYQYLNDRDFILIEQRGCKYAKPRLDCPEWSESVYYAGLPTTSPEQAAQRFAQAARNCRNQLSSEGIDLNSFNTVEIAQDISDLVQALQIETYNLLAISYSTKIAQVLLRDQPERIRSVVMDSPLPLEVNYDEESIANLLEAMELVLQKCQQDPKCNQAHPKLKQRLFDFLGAATEDPITVDVQNPTTNENESFQLQGKDFLQLLQSGPLKTLPEIAEQILQGDYSEVKAQLSQKLEYSPNRNISMGMRLSVWCAEEAPFSSLQIIDRETHQRSASRGLSPAVFTEEVCRIWNVSPANPRENQAVTSDIPVLLISGEYDYETPPKWAKAMQQNLSNSHHLIFKEWEHTPTTNWGNSCAMEMANAFFNDPSQLPTADCFEQLSE